MNWLDFKGRKVKAGHSKVKYLKWFIAGAVTYTHRRLCVEVASNFASVNVCIVVTSAVVYPQIDYYYSL